jgi:hypothetical protein
VREGHSFKSLIGHSLINHSRLLGPEFRNRGPVGTAFSCGVGAERRYSNDLAMLLIPPRRRNATKVR